MAEAAASAGPPAEVLSAFGLKGEPRRLPGGNGTSWASNGAVLKPDADPVLQAWLGTELHSVRENGFRVARPLPAKDGSWTCRGWSASILVDGAEPNHRKRPRWRDILDAGRAFHRAVATVPEPYFLGTARSWWAIADRAAWGECEPKLDAGLGPTAERLRAACTDLGSPQLVHGDLTGNVLFADGKAPAIIDISPYWRPPLYAEGVVIADALCWHGARRDLLQETGVPVPAVARALLFRIHTTQARMSDGIGTHLADDEAGRYARAASLIGL